LDPPLAEDIDPRELAPEVRAELRSLNRTIAEVVARRLVAAGELLDIEPEQAYAHAQVARRVAARIPAVREAVGLAAYRSGRWQTAISELRAYHRMAGKQGHLAVLADCERALDRPERAIDLFRATDLSQLDQAERIELLIVVAGARLDLKQAGAAAAMLQIDELETVRVADWLPRLRYAYADALLAVGRTEEARAWFARAAEVDEDVMTDAAERLLELDGVVLEDDEDDEDDVDVEDNEDDVEDDDEDDVEDDDEDDVEDDDEDDEDDVDNDDDDEVAGSAGPR
jgi:tetratricopeptide (TPR) repeat protein